MNSPKIINHIKINLEMIILTLVLLVLGQNGSGQNGTDKMVWTKWYTNKMALDKMVWTKWHRQNITDNVTNQSISHLQYEFFINPASALTPSAFLYVLNIYI